MATLTTNLNYLQPTSFKLGISRTNYPNLEFFCQSVSHPGMYMNSVETPYQKLQGIPIPGDKLTFNELTANIILDENMTSYEEMYKWIRRILDTNMGGNIRGMTIGDSHYADLTLHILNSSNNLVKQIVYKDCVPTSLGDISLESTGTGTEYIVYTASFRFSYFDLKTVDASGAITDSFTVTNSL